jgi:hypothetical protein
MRQKERGIALLIAIFILLLISVVAIALIVSSGTESALAGNYRSSTDVYYAAMAGLEEARGRLAAKNPNSFKATTTGFLPAGGAPFAIGGAVYVINPAGSETIAPWDSGSTYPDTEFQSEFASSGFPAPPNPSPSALSIWSTSPLNTLPVPAPLYKWVRINAVSERSLNIDVDADGNADSVTPLYYDGAHFSNNSTAGPQVLEITSYAVLLNGSQKLLQYLVVRNGLDLSFPAALTLDGGVNTFESSKNASFWVSGLDQQHGGNCPPASPESPKPAIGATSSGAVSEVRDGIPPYSGAPNYHYDHYVSISPQPTDPSIGNISGSLIPAFQTEASLDNVSPPGLVQNLSATGVADYLITGPASTLPDFGSPTRMVTTIVAGSSPGDGDLNLSGSADGYGLLVVTGDLRLDGDASWHGIILVIGQGHVYIPNAGNGEIDGAVLIARTRHFDYSFRPSLGSVIFDVDDTNDGNNGFWYNSCWVQAALPAATYKVLSFHEISQ